MTKQGQFQVDNFDKFHNSDLGFDLERIITSAESLYENNESLSISRDNEESFDYPYGICVEGTCYFYANESEREDDMNKLVDLVKEYLLNNFLTVKTQQSKLNISDVSRSDKKEVSYDDIEKLTEEVQEFIKSKGFDIVDEFEFLTKLEKVLYEGIDKHYD